MSCLFASRGCRELALVLIYTLLALLLTYPLPLYLSTHVAGPPIDAPALTWNLWWMKFALLERGVNPLFSDYIYFPIGVNLVAYTSTFLNGVLSLPLQFAFGVVAANNLLVYISLVLGGYGAFLLARAMLPRGTRHADLAASLAGAFYAVGAWHINYVLAGAFMFVSNQWIPFYAFFLLRSNGVRARNGRAWRNGALAGLFFVLTSWTELTFIPFLVLLTVLYLFYLLVANRRAMNRHLVRTLIALVVVAAIGISPLISNLVVDILRYGYYLSPGLGRVQIFSADLLSYVIPSGLHPLFGAWAQNLSHTNRSYAYVGFAGFALAILGFMAGRQSQATRFWGLAALVFGLILLGPVLIVNGQVTAIPMPFELLRQLPFVNANRYPVRFNVMMMLALAVLIAMGAARLLHSRRGMSVLMALCGLLALEQLVVPLSLSDLRVPPIFDRIRAEAGDFTVLDLPLGWRNSVSLQGKMDYTAQFFQTTHQKRLLGGLTSRNPAFKFQYFLELPVINSLIALETGGEIDDVTRARDRAVAPDILKFFHIRYIHVARALTPAPVLEYVREMFPLTEVYADDERIVYRVESLASCGLWLATCGERRPDEEYGGRVEFDPASDAMRAAFDYGWGHPQWDGAGVGYRWATEGEARLWLPLEAGTYDFSFRLRAPRPSQRVSLRINGHPVAQWDVGDAWGTFAAHLPSEIVRDGLDELVFVTETTPLVGTGRQPVSTVLDDRTIGATGVTAPVDIAAIGAGFAAGKFGAIFVAGRNVIPNVRGYHLVVIHPQTGVVDAVGSFDTFADTAESARLARFIENVPAGYIVAGVAIDEVSRHLGATAVAALRQIGVAEDLRGQFRAGHAFIGLKGAAPGTAMEDVNARYPANVSVGKNVTQPQVALALGPFELVHAP